MGDLYQPDRHNRALFAFLAPTTGPHAGGHSGRTEFRRRGVFTASAAVALAEKLDVDMPITAALMRTEPDADIDDAIGALLARIETADLPFRFRRSGGDSGASTPEKGRGPDAILALQIRTQCLVLGRSGPKRRRTLGRRVELSSQQQHEGHGGKHRAILSLVNEKQIVGITSREGTHPDQQTHPRFVIDVKAIEPVKTPVTLADIKAELKSPTLRW